MVGVSDLMRQHAHIYIITVEAGNHPALPDREDINAHPEAAFTAARLGIDPSLGEHLLCKSAQLRAEAAEAGDNHRLRLLIGDHT
ncbi:hypothetical protein D3C80_1574160 [compost metagenome]